MPRWRRISFFLLASLALVHFAMSICFAWNVSWLAILLGSSAAAISIPATRRGLGNLPAFSRPSARIGLFWLLIVLAHISLDRGNYVSESAKSRAYVNATLFTGHPNAPLINDSAIVVDALGMITYVGSRKDAPIPDGRIGK